MNLRPLCANVAVVIDLYSRYAVGWSMSASMTSQLVSDALDDGIVAPRKAEGIAASLGPRQSNRTQLVVATRLLFAERNTFVRASAGVRHSRLLRGLLLSVRATASRSVMLCILKSVPFGKYCRSNPLVFSLVPRCHGLCGSPLCQCDLRHLEPSEMPPIRLTPPLG